ncbi:hypothetical protein BGX31_005318 [Mortierella sp. GBA43]|nr:hypothetical protein BGX31_005318 [Mortierella sp. GBA43]
MNTRKRTGVAPTWLTPTWVVPSRAVPSRSGQNTGYKNLESITISPAGDMIATVSSGSGGVQLWDASKGSSSRTLCDNSEGGDGVATSVVFSPKGDQIAFCRGKTVQLWSVASGQRQAIIKDFQGSVHSIAWCPSLGQDHLLVGEEHGTVQVWKVSNSGGQYDMGLIWTSDSRLTLTGASMSGAQGLSDWNKRLLKQRGAVNVPDLS